MVLVKNVASVCNAPSKLTGVTQPLICHRFLADFGVASCSVLQDSGKFTISYRMQC